MTCLDVTSPNHVSCCGTGIACSRCLRGLHERFCGISAALKIYLLNGVLPLILDRVLASQLPIPAYKSRQLRTFSGAVRSIDPVRVLFNTLLFRDQCVAVSLQFDELCLAPCVGTQRSPLYE